MTSIASYAKDYEMIVLTNTESDLNDMSFESHILNILLLMDPIEVPHQQGESLEFLHFHSAILGEYTLK